MTKRANSAVEAVACIKSDQAVFIHSAAAAPNVLTQALAERHNELENVKIYHLHTEGSAPYAKPEFANSFNVNSFFIGGNVREVTEAGYADYIPSFLSEIPPYASSGYNTY